MAGKATPATAKASTKSGILASMGKKATEKAVEKAPAAATPAATPAFDWASVGAPTVAVYTRNTSGRRSVETTTPQFIKDCVTKAFEATSKNLVKGKPVSVWMMLKFDTAERAAEFVKLAKKYATFRDYTMRGEANPDYVYVTGENGEPAQVEGVGYVRYCVKVRETRKQAAK